MTRRTHLSALLAAAFLAAAAANAQPAGVTLYEGVRMTGEHFTMTQDVFDLNDTPFGARRASSVDVSPGCRVTLFESSGYRGSSAELAERDIDLGNTRLGRGSVASARVDCRGAGDAHWGREGGRRERGVTLFRDSDLEGPSETFGEDVPDLDRTRVGARQASSIEVPPGCVATLFSRPGFRGRSTTFHETENNLRDTPVGNDTASSLRVDCGNRERARGPRREEGRRADDVAVTLFLDKDFRGGSESFVSDVPDLSRTRIGARSASSIRVTPGCRVTLFSERDYQGRSATFDDEHSNLRNTPVGNDAARSMRVECGPGRR